MIGRRRAARRRSGLTDRGWALAAAGLPLSLAGVGLGFVDVTRIGLLLLSLPILALLGTQFLHTRLEVERRLATPSPHVGQSARVRLLARHTSGWPSLPSTAVEQCDPVWGDPRRFSIPALGRHGTWVADYAVCPRRRGHHDLGPLELQVSDPLGLTRRQLSVPGQERVLVLPVIHPLAGLEAVTSGSDGGAGVRWSTGGGPDHVALRAYREGDDLRHIHWPVSAHRGELIVRQEGEAPVRRAALVLDTDLPLVGESSPALDWTVEALASIGTHLGDHGFQVTLATTEDLGHEGMGRTLDVEEMVRVLAAVEARSGRQPEVALQRLAAATRQLSSVSGVVILVCGTHRPDRARTLLDTLGHPATGLALLLDTSTFAPTFASTPAIGSVGAMGADTDLRGERTRPPASRVAVALSAAAASGGWRTALVTGAEPVPRVWQRLVQEQPLERGSAHGQALR